MIVSALSSCVRSLRVARFGPPQPRPFSLGVPREKGVGIVHALVVVGVGLLVVGCGGGSDYTAAGSNTKAPGTKDGAAKAGDAKPDAANKAAAAPAAEITLKTLDFEGIEKLVASHRGKVVVMDAWSTACAPCLKEFPNLVALHRKHAANGVACISLSFDYDGLGKVEEVSGPVLDFLKTKGATFDNVISSEEADVLYGKFDLTAVPAVFVYDKTGKLRKRFDNEQASKNGVFTYAQVEALVAELIKE